MRTVRLTFLTTLALLAAAVTAPTALAEHAHAHASGPKHKLTASTSTNWSGYAVDGTNASSVTGSWTVQPAQCAPRETSWSSPWVGIDGDNSSTVEQTGTDTDCKKGTPSYYAWYEMYPKGFVTIGEPVTPGDSMTGTVTYEGAGAFLLTLVDHTAGWTNSVTQSSTKAPRSSVEWIVEGPSTGTLTDFGTLSFSADSATINGETESLQSFGSSADAITMATKKGVVRAAPSPLSKKGGFSDTWQSG